MPQSIVCDLGILGCQYDDDPARVNDVVPIPRLSWSWIIAYVFSSRIWRANQRDSHGARGIPLQYRRVNTVMIMCILVMSVMLYVCETRTLTANPEEDQDNGNEMLHAGVSCTNHTNTSSPMRQCAIGSSQPSVLANTFYQLLKNGDYDGMDMWYSGRIDWHL